MKRFAITKAARNPPRHGRERSLSFAVRIVSGIQACPRDAGGVRHAVPRIVRLYPQGESCRKSPDRERPPVLDPGYFNVSARLTMSSMLMRPSATETVRSARGCHVIDQREPGQRRVLGAARAGCRRPMRRSRQLIAAVRPAILEDAVAHQRLQTGSRRGGCLARERLDRVDHADADALRSGHTLTSGGTHRSSTSG